MQYWTKMGSQNGFSVQQSPRGRSQISLLILNELTSISLKS